MAADRVLRCLSRVVRLVQLAQDFKEWPNKYPLWVLCYMIHLEIVCVVLCGSSERLVKWWVVVVVVVRGWW